MISIDHDPMNFRLLTPDIAQGVVARRLLDVEFSKVACKRTVVTSMMKLKESKMPFRKRVVERWLVRAIIPEIQGDEESERSQKCESSPSEQTPLTSTKRLKRNVNLEHSGLTETSHSLDLKPNLSTEKNYLAEDENRQGGSGEQRKPKYTQK